MTIFTANMDIMWNNISLQISKRGDFKLDILWAFIYENFYYCIIIWFVTFIFAIYLSSKHKSLSNLLHLIIIISIFFYLPYGIDRSKEEYQIETTLKAQTCVKNIKQQIFEGNEIIVIKKDVLYIDDASYLMDVERCLLAKNYKPVREDKKLIYYQKLKDKNNG